VLSFFSHASSPSILTEERFSPFSAEARQKNEAVAHYALGNLPNKVLASQYKLALPGEKELAQEIAKTRKALLQQIQRTK
jgi:hypothetical protein